MALQTLAVPNPPVPNAGPETSTSSLAESARIEFHAALQLLAERAAFVTGATGVAIAIEDAGSFSYRVATGTGVAEPETAVDIREENVQTCMHSAESLFMSAGLGFKLMAAVNLNQKFVGFMEVVGQHEFSDLDLTTITRLAGLAGVALEHLQAATNADARLWEKLQEPLSPKLWHAPESAAQEPSSNHDTRTDPHTEVHLCRGCGFPVSPGRKLCVECEQKPAAPVSAPAELFSAPPQASWFSEHGYTIASLIVSAIAAAVIFWLRR